MQSVVYIQEVFNITGIGAVLVGNVKSGTLKIGMKLRINGKNMTVKTIEKHHEKLQVAHEGDNIGFALSGGDYNSLKPVIKQDVTFSDEENIETRVTEKPTNAYGFFDSVKRLFKRV